MFCQVKFQDTMYNHEEVHGGIAKLNDKEEIEYVICGCCGCIFDLNEITILKKYNSWVNLDDSIIGDD